MNYLVGIARTLSINTNCGISRGFHTSCSLAFTGGKTREVIFDPEIAKLREKRRRRRLEKELKELKKHSKKLKPVEELSMTVKAAMSWNERRRKLPPMNEIEMEDARQYAESVDTDYEKWASEQSRRDIMWQSNMLRMQKSAMETLQKMSPELYEEAVKADTNFLPFTIHGPALTPPLENYQSPDGIPWLGRAPNLPYSTIPGYHGTSPLFHNKLISVQICSLNPYLDSLLKDVEAIKRIMNVYTTIILRAARTNELLAAEGEETPTEIETMKRVKRQLNTTFFEPAYSECNCSKPIREEDLECTANKTSVPNKSLEEYEEGGIEERAMCLCAFDRESGDAWPCYPHQKWSERICGYCDSHSFCTLDEKPGCYAFKDSEIVKLWHYYGFFEEEKEIETLGFQNMSDEITIVNKAKENLIYAMSELSEKQRIALSIPKSQLIQKCSFNGKACDIDKDFSVIADPTFGNCYTFNHNRNETKSSIRAGPANGLRLSLFVNASQYLPITESGCYRSCFQEMVTKNCGCADPRFPTPPGISHCEVFNSTSRMPLLLPKLLLLKLIIMNIQENVWKNKQFNLVKCTSYLETVVKKVPAVNASSHVNSPFIQVLYW
ncbi:mitochondrial ribosomal protein l28 domain-containing protein [Ditylenchus destructor]|uniref:Large ribosomal subunit protein mL40 n=1 Tax=Ditylenchus destructor TaxID=166010 RepID=A0AAD4R277_9BILA|nr:mitochondrial ribosomal protein l28 domain-containing protein [Ditylenchus destructor]